MRYLAIDYGIKRTGLAICDAAETIASPLAILEGRKNLAERIFQIIRHENVTALVVGLPFNMNGSRGPQAELVCEFAAELGKLTNLPIHFQDERLSSFAAEGKLACVKSGRQKKKKPLDAVAAAQILEDFLDEKNSDKSHSQRQY